MARQAAEHQQLSHWRRRQTDTSDRWPAAIPPPGPTVTSPRSASCLPLRASIGLPPASGAVPGRSVAPMPAPWADTRRPRHAEPPPSSNSLACPGLVSASLAAHIGARGDRDRVRWLQQARHRRWCARSIAAGPRRHRCSITHSDLSRLRGLEYRREGGRRRHASRRRCARRSSAPLRPSSSTRSARKGRSEPARSHRVTHPAIRHDAAEGDQRPAGRSCLAPVALGEKSR